VRVLLISPNTEMMNMPTLPLGLTCVAATTRDAGHAVQERLPTGLHLLFD
jgi:hypothetical protein